MKRQIQKVQRAVIRTHKPYAHPYVRYGGKYVVYTCKAGILQKHQLEIVRMYLLKKLKYFKVRIIMRTELNKPFTKKAKQARMGKGKGKFAYWYSRVDYGTPLFEICPPASNGTIAIAQSLRLTHVCFLLKRIQARFTLPLKCYLKKNDLCLNTSICRR